MSFIKPDLNTIITRIEADITSRLTGEAALLRRSMLAILARVFAGAIHTAYGFLDFISIQLLPDLATGDYLNRHAIMWSIDRVAATFSTGAGEFPADPGSTIPADTIIIRDDGVEYTVDTLATESGGSIIVDLTASVAGSNGNAAVSSLLSLLSPISGVTDDGEVSTALTGGSDEETDADLRERILQRIRNPPAGGSAADYEAAALTVSGVAKAFIFGNQNGLAVTPGYVTAVILGDSPAVPGAPILAEVQTALDAIKPVTAEVTVEPIVEALLDFDISISPNTTEFRTIIDANMETLLGETETPGGTILISHVRDAIISAGVDDYEITVIEVDSTPVAIANIVLTDFEFPVLNSITYATL